MQSWENRPKGRRWKKETEKENYRLARVKQLWFRDCCRAFFGFITHLIGSCTIGYQLRSLSAFCFERTTSDYSTNWRICSGIDLEVRKITYLLEGSWYEEYFGLCFRNRSLNIVAELPYLSTHWNRCVGPKSNSSELVSKSTWKNLTWPFSK